MSGEEEFEKLENGLKTLGINYQRVLSKFQHLNDGVNYLADEILLLKACISTVFNLFTELKEKKEKKEKVEEEVKEHEHG